MNTAILFSAMIEMMRHVHHDFLCIYTRVPQLPVSPRQTVYSAHTRWHGNNPHGRV